MARMIPKSIDSATASNAERLMFELFQNQLPGDYTVLHAIGWTHRERGRADRDGEADFVVIHPTLGLLVLEVKGGRVRMEGETGRWLSVDAAGHEHEIRNPFDQAMRNKYSLNDLIRGSATASGARYAYTHGVAFPDVRIDGNPFGAGIERSMWLDSTGIGTIEQAIRGMYGSPDGSRRLTPADIRAIVDLLRPTREITRLGLAAAVRHGEREVTELTERQYDLLRFLDYHPRARIEGCAGSGKTMLAMEKARRLAAQGFEVLVTCFNKGLAAGLRRQLAEDGRPELERITVQHYHDLAMAVCEEAGMPQVVPAGIDATPFWEITLPEAFMAALSILPDRRYDAIIVDEGQDFLTDWWVTLEELLRDPVHGVFYIFHDDNQRIYQRVGDMPVPDAPYPLDSNCRNTRRIHEAVMRFYHERPKPQANGPEGREIEVVPLDRDVVTTVRKVVADLVDGEGLTTKQIVVLTPRSAARSALSEGTRLGNRRITWSPTGGATTVQASSIHAFKGLERDVVILAETDGLRTAHSQPDMLCYVALSRARHHVVVLGELPDPEPDPT